MKLKKQHSAALTNSTSGRTDYPLKLEDRDELKGCFLIVNIVKLGEEYHARYDWVELRKHSTKIVKHWEITLKRLTLENKNLIKVK